eukprot:358882-Chlamydomonas_euryale.AAC.2
MLAAAASTAVDTTCDKMRCSKTGSRASGAAPRLAAEDTQTFRRESVGCAIPLTPWQGQARHTSGEPVSVPVPEPVLMRVPVHVHMRYLCRQLQQVLDAPSSQSSPVLPASLPTYHCQAVAERHDHQSRKLRVGEELMRAYRIPHGEHVAEACCRQRQMQHARRHQRQPHNVAPASQRVRAAAAAEHDESAGRDRYRGDAGGERVGGTKHAGVCEQQPRVELAQPERRRQRATRMSPLLSTLMRMLLRLLLRRRMQLLRRGGNRRAFRHYALESLRELQGKGTRSIECAVAEAAPSCQLGCRV